MSDSDSILRTVLLVIVVLVSVPFVMLLAAVPLMGGMHTGTWGGGMGAGGWAWMALLPVFVLLLIGYGAYRLLGGGDDSDPAIEALREAYARGELTDEEYEARRQRLEADRGGDGSR